MKPGWKTSEFWISVGGTVLMVLVALGFVTKDDASGLGSAWANTVGAALALAAAAAPILRYVGARAGLKSQWLEALLDQEDSHRPFPPGGGTLPALLLAVGLGLAGGAAQAQQAQAPGVRAAADS